MPGVRLAYESWGELNADKSNAILLCHALSGSQVERLKILHDPAGSGQLLVDGLASEGFRGGHDGILLSSGPLRAGNTVGFTRKVLSPFCLGKVASGT